MLKKKHNFIPYILVIAAAIAGYFYFFKGKTSPQPNAMQQQMPPAQVDVMVVQKHPVNKIVEMPARISGHKITQVRPQVSGIIKQRLFTEGEFVKEGQQLYQIDPVIYEAAYNKTKTNLNAVRAKRDRYKNLLEQEVISKQEFDDIEASLAQAKSDYESAKESFKYTKVFAPISGYIGKTNVTEGALVSANQVDPLTTISALDPIYADIAMASSDAVLLRKQKNIKVDLIINEKTYSEQGELKMVESFADETTDSVQLRALFPNQDQTLLPGMFATAKLYLAPVDSITVPQRATIRNASGNLSLWVVEGNIARARQIKADKTFKDQWIVEEGLNEGEVVIINGTMKLFDGASVLANVKSEENMGDAR